MKEFIEYFFNEVGKNYIEIYNEFSLQHELGIFLRDELESKKIQFERNVSYFDWEKNCFPKKEIDISIICENKKPDTAIELKYPRNKQYPEQMYSFCKDIAFVEKLHCKGFREAFAIILVDDKLFYSGPTKKRIYTYFRDSANLTGKIQKPTGNIAEEIRICGNYNIDWQSVGDKLKYALVHVG